jgi:hypothetical protein
MNQAGSSWTSLVAEQTLRAYPRILNRCGTSRGFRWFSDKLLGYSGPELMQIFMRTRH